VGHAVLLIENKALKDKRPDFSGRFFVAYVVG
jgi:hypothetical protein